MRMLDLFSGLEGASQPWKARGHDVVTVDIDPRFRPTLQANIMTLRPEILEAYGPFDFIWASPPCTTFTVMTISRHWTPDGEPRIEAALALELIARTLALIEALAPAAWVLENPVGMLRKQDVVAPFDRATVTYCQYGLPYQKRTDLWGGFPPTLQLRPPCSRGSSCHEAAPRGSSRGVQGLWGAATRAMVPYELGLDVCLAMEGLQVPATKAS